jgi:type VI secretion system secreted protein Hcp
MKRAIYPLLAGCCCILISQSVAHASCSIFLKIGEIDGSSTDPQYTDWIEVDSWQLGAQQSRFTATATTGTLGGRSEFFPLTITKRMDNASPELFQACAMGTLFDSATLVLRNSVSNAPPTAYLELRLTTVLISSYSVGGAASSPDCTPTEAVSLNFTKMEIEYKTQMETNGAPPTLSFDLKKKRSE